MNQKFIIENTDTDIQEIRNELEKSNNLLNLIFEKQEVMTNDEERTREYIVPSQTIDCIENIQSDNMHLVEKLEQYGEKHEFDVQLLLRESEIFYHGHEYQQAIKTADFILENMDNENTHALVVKGNSLTRLGQFEKAIETYDHAITINPDFVEGLFHMGRVLSSNDQHDMAIRHFDHAIKIDPSYADAYIGKAFTLMILERYDDAVKSAEKSCADIPGQIRIQGNLQNSS